MTSGERSRPYVELVQERQCSSVNRVTREGQHIGGFHTISGDTNNNGQMNKC